MENTWLLDHQKKMHQLPDPMLAPSATHTPAHSLAQAVGRYIIADLLPPLTAAGHPVNARCLMDFVLGDGLAVIQPHVLEEVLQCLHQQYALQVCSTCPWFDAPACCSHVVAPCAAVCLRHDVFSVHSYLHRQGKGVP